ncbi:Protein CBG26485 [Caenorhabditis briggsae]|uniref:Protein CBG26485 n=1 Tax=Caenorhabditis briggsae TaxID=6238 RepID=B6IH36_CAEBR|nr:Protein CBG26485 [Caenorhabditis briggsae]CAR99216.1 Protein CBG26485 [Caenorhabditis briggsae]
MKTWVERRGLEKERKMRKNGCAGNVKIGRYEKNN